MISDEVALEAWRLIYSLEYRVEDVNTTTGNVLSVVIPELEALVPSAPKKARDLAAKLLDAIGEKPLSEDHLRECFPAYCEAIGVEFVED